MSAGQRYFDFIAKGDAGVATAKCHSEPGLGFFRNRDHGQGQSVRSGRRKGTARPPFLLEADGTAPIPRAEFYCGVFGKNGQTSDSAAFYLNNLPPGKYAVVIFDAPTPKGAVHRFLHTAADRFRLEAGRPLHQSAEIGGHNSDWFLTHAREFKTKGQAHNAWLYYLEARSLISPLPFMSTAATDKLYDESQKAQPADLPADGKTVRSSRRNHDLQARRPFP